MFVLVLLGVSDTEHYARMLERWPGVTSFCAGRNGVYGFGACTTGGNGLTSIVVDDTNWVSPGAGAFNLNHCTDGDSGTKCNFAEAVCRSNAHVTFSVSGAITIPNVANNDGSDNTWFEFADCPASSLPIKNLTIDGSTAPGAGVYLEGSSFILDGPAGGGVASNVRVVQLRHYGSDSAGVGLSTGFGISGCVNCVIDHVTVAFPATYGFYLGNNLTGHENEKNRNITISNNIFAYSHILHEYQGASAATSYSGAGTCSIDTARSCCIDGDGDPTPPVGQCADFETCSGETTACQVRGEPGLCFSIPGASASPDAGNAASIDWDCTYGIASAYCGGPGAHANKRAGLQYQHGGIRRQYNNAYGLCEGGTNAGASCQTDAICSGGGTCRNECEQATEDNYAIGPWLRQGMDNYGPFMGGNTINLSYYRNLMLGFRWRQPNFSLDTSTGGTTTTAADMAQGGSIDIAQNWAYGGRFMSDLWSQYSTRNASIILSHNAHENNAETRALFADFESDAFTQANASSGAFVVPSAGQRNVGANVRHYFMDNRDTWTSVGAEACYRGADCGTGDEYSWSCADTAIGCSNVAGNDDFANGGYYGRRGPAGSMPAFPGTFAALKAAITSDSGAQLPCPDAVTTYIAELVNAGKALRVLHLRDEVGGVQQDMSVCPSAVTFAGAITAQSKTGASAVADVAGSGIGSTTATVTTTENRMLKLHCGIESQGSVNARVRDPRCSGGTVTLDWDAGAGGAALATGCYPFTYWASIGSWANRAIGTIEVDVGGGGACGGAQSITVTYPNGGEEIPQGNSVEITWESVSVTSVDIAVSSTGCGGSFTNIVTATPSDGSYLWTAPTTTGTNYCIRVQDTDASPTDTSAAVFSIVDLVAPNISAVNATSIATTSATIVWTTNEVSDSRVDYGTTASYGSNATNASDVTSHSLAISGLSSSTLYHYAVTSCDPAGNCSTSPDATFTTLTSGGGGGPVCTHGPYTSATSLTTIRGVINGAANSAVVCLLAGEVWTQTSGGAAFQQFASHPNAERVTVCTSDATKCIDGATNARINLVGFGNSVARFNSNVGGYTFRNIDFYGSSGTCTNDQSDNDSAIMTNNGNANIMFEGVTISGFGKVWRMCNHRTSCGTTGENENLSFGSPTRKNRVTSCVSSSRWMQYGACKDCYFSFDLDGWGGTTGSGGFVHVLDFNLWTDSDPDTENVTIENGRWELASASTDIGSVIKAAYGRNMIVRNMEIVETEPTSITGTAPGGIHIEGHTCCGPGVVGWEGAQIYNNYFALGNSHQAILLSRLGWDIDFYNNVIDSNGNMTPAGGTFISITDSQTVGQGAPIEFPNNVRVFNNTFYIPDASSAPVLQSNVASTNNAAWNNLIIDDRTTARIFESDCGDWGTAGASLDENFVYSQNDATPNLGGCGSATWQPGGSYNTAPGIADTTPEVDDVQDFDITDSSAVSDIGSATPTFPATDIEGAAQTNPPSIGAFSENEP